MTDTHRIVVVDDHPLMREGVVHAFNSDQNFDVVAEGADKTDAVSLAEKHAPDVMLLDINMPGGGIAAATAITQLNRDIKIVMLTVSEDERNVHSALQAGARGYILKGVSGASLVRSIKTICDGESYVSPDLAARLLNGSTSTNVASSASALDKLNSREEQILMLVAEGKSNREIGELLTLSEQTIKHYVSAILQKLNVRNRVEATLIARELTSVEI